MTSVSDTTVKDILAKAEELRSQLSGNIYQELVESAYSDAARIADRAVTRPDETPRFDWDITIDRVVTSRIWGFPMMMLMLSVVFWLTIAGANVPSAMLASLLLETVYQLLKGISGSVGLVWWLDGLLIDGIYLSTAWVISVMLPPMAIFFPLFTLLEDFGYLPRVAFNLDNIFRKVGGHGKQAMTMAMGWGCNAAGVIATRIIDSPRERLIAIITNNFALCNGRWPTQIMIATVFIGSLAPTYLAGVVSAIAVVGIAMLGIFLTFVVSWALSQTVLKGEVSTFSLELPPYRPPRILQTIYTSLMDRTILVLMRAVLWAVPAGALIWLSSNIHLGPATGSGHAVSIAEHLIVSFDPFGLLLGLNGVILLAYILAIPANEIVIPTVLMLTVLSARISDVGAGAGIMFETDSETQLLSIFTSGGWTLVTAVNLMLFSLLHNPCSTTIHTIYKETRSAKWTIVASVLPVSMGFAVTFIVAQVWRLVSG
jgi:ferrous iron transport protein B